MRLMAGIHLIHCSYHKCLTVYYSRVMTAIFNRCLPWGRGYRHFNSNLEDFYGGFAQYRVASVNNRSLDLSRLGEFRISRFLRDPRDLVVSGYFYHRRGAEDWCRIEAPSEDDWYFANGTVPAGMRGKRISFAAYLESLSQEEGLLAELEFRRRHFESMSSWPDNDPRIMSWRYEEVAGSESRVFGELFDFYDLGPVERLLGGLFARRYSIRKQAADTHVRNPNPGQWRQHFTPRVKQAFDADFGQLIEQLGYPSE